MTSIQNDPKAFPFMVSDKIWSEIPALNTSSFQRLKLQIRPKVINNIYVVPKFDGSLFNLLCIHSSNKIYQFIEAFVKSGKLPPNSYYLVGDLIFVFGSKGTVFSKNPVNQRIHNAICGSYESVDKFLEIMSAYVNQVGLFDISNQILTLHFEAIDVVPTPELTVNYDKAWCPFFGLTIFDSRTNEKSFKLPINEYRDTSFKSIAEVYECKNWTEVYELYDRLHQELLEGNMTVEPEGFVLHIYGEDGEWVPIKFKFREYYAGHKPESKHNLEMAQKLSSDSKYDILRKRLAKFREKPSVQTLIERSIDDLETIQRFYQDIISSGQFGLDQTKPILPKDWAMYWTKFQKNLTTSTEFVHAFQNLYMTVAEHYPQYVLPVDMLRQIFTFNMNLKIPLNLTENQVQLYDLAQNQSKDKIVQLLVNIIFN
jgi:hypothetical protein